MESTIVKNDTIRFLREQVHSLQGGKKSLAAAPSATGLGPILTAFPGNTFPTATVHELLSNSSEDAAATNGFLAAVLGNLILHSGICIWISTRRTLFPPALKFFGMNPERVIFVDIAGQKDALWVVEEALKCGAVAAVVGELPALSFTESRRLQLAVEQSRVTGFIHRCKPRSENTVACTTRWKIKSLPGASIDGLPGVGYPRWQVQLDKVRNGRPGLWTLEWAAGEFRHLSEQPYAVPAIQALKTG